MSILREDGRLFGAWERPSNIVSGWRGSIHDDDTARGFGFEGGFVSARVHLNVFVPVLVEAFGTRWFEQGTLSLDFRSGTLHQEPVRAVVEEPSPQATDTQVDARLERESGELVALGTASVGACSEPTLLRAEDLTAHDEGPYALVDVIVPGDDFPVVEIRLGPRHAEKMARSAAYSPWYLEDSPWGGPIASPAFMVNALGAGCSAYLRDHPVSGVPVDGGTELRNLNGPLFVGRTYRVSGRMLARGQSPRTEYFWYDAWIDDETDARIAEMRLQWRCMKPT
jgi:hypothetical protein